MTLCCYNCNKKETFPKYADFTDFKQAGWAIKGIHIIDNTFYFSCPECEAKWRETHKEQKPPFTL